MVVNKWLSTSCNLSRFPTTSLTNSTLFFLANSGLETLVHATSEKSNLLPCSWSWSRLMQVKWADLNLIFFFLQLLFSPPGTSEGRLFRCKRPSLAPTTKMVFHTEQNENQVLRHLNKLFKPSLVSVHLKQNKMHHFTQRDLIQFIYALIFQTFHVRKIKAKMKNEKTTPCPTVF